MKIPFMILSIYAISALSASVIPDIFTATAQSSDGTSVLGLTIAHDAGYAVKDDDVPIAATLRNDGAIEAAVSYVVQVKDPGERVVSISLSVLVLGGGEAREITTSWRAEAGGVHTFQVFVWLGEESPSGISYTSAELVVKTDMLKECMGTAACNNAPVNGIIDGDTLTIGGITVRLALVDTPERGERGYAEATLFTSRVCPIGSTVLVDEDDGQKEGSYGRMIAKVYCIGGMLNQELLEFNHAVILVKHCQESEFGHEGWATRYGCPAAE